MKKSSRTLVGGVIAAVLIFSAAPSAQAADFTCDGQVHYSNAHSMNGAYMFNTVYKAIKRLGSDGWYYSKRTRTYDSYNILFADKTTYFLCYE